MCDTPRRVQSFDKVAGLHLALSVLLMDRHGTEITTWTNVVNSLWCMGSPNYIHLLWHSMLVLWGLFMASLTKENRDQIWAFSGRQEGKTRYKHPLRINCRCEPCLGQIWNNVVEFWSSWSKPRPKDDWNTVEGP